MSTGFIIAAPHSGSGKTTITLGLLRAFTRAGQIVRGAKSGPDYIDPRFHEAACGAPCRNLDAWAMGPDRIRDLAQGDGMVIVEGAMGLFDGAPPDGRGATADLARILGLPVVLVVDAGRMAHSIAPLVAGFARHDSAVTIAGVILNNVGSERHDRMLRAALASGGIPVLGTLARTPALGRPARHLGLVQAGEHPDLDAFLNTAADAVEAGIDLSALMACAAPLPPGANALRLTPPAQAIAIARDHAFSFAYPHMLDDWYACGAAIATFSPLADEPVPPCDLVILPGGYPELFAGRLAANSTFMQSLRNASQDSDIYGECGGYMVLGETLTDADGQRHAMAGLLRLDTSFATRGLHLGYRSLTAIHGPFAGQWNGHEFHYATTLRAQGQTLFSARDAEGTALPDMGLRHGRVSGSFAHLIDRTLPLAQSPLP